MHSVNLAQSLQSSAQPGQVTIQKSTYAIVKNKFIAEALDLLTVKSRAQLVEVYLLEDMK